MHRRAQRAELIYTEGDQPNREQRFFNKRKKQNLLRHKHVMTKGAVFVAYLDQKEFVQVGKDYKKVELTMEQSAQNEAMLQLHSWKGKVEELD